MSSGGTNTVTQQSQPPAAFMNAYTGVNNQATALAQQPLQQYQGPQVAGFSPEQNMAVGGINATAGAAQPYLTGAQQDIQASQAPLLPGIEPYLNQAQDMFQPAGQGITFNPVTASQIQQYESPYTKSVVNSTQAEFNNQNAQQQSGIQGNAISQGAFGGDRAGVAQGIAAGQEQLAQAPVIAGLENQGYSQALGEANTQQQTQLQQEVAQQQAELTGAQGIAGLGQTALGANEANAWLNSQAGYGMANLGNEAIGTGLQTANAQLGVGGLQQQVAQEGLNVPYEQFLAQQAYPFQTTGWQAGIAEGLGGASGGSSSTTSPGPSTASQLTGLGITGLALNGMGAFNGIGSGLSSLYGSLAGAGSAAGALGDASLGAGLFIKRGGGVPERAIGGGLGKVAPFPGHLARMPGTGKGGLTANDNSLHIPHPFMPRMKLAAGGSPDFQDNYDLAESEPTSGGIAGTGPIDLTADNSLPIPPIPPPHGGHGITARGPDSGGGLPTPPMPPGQTSGPTGSGIVPMPMAAQPQASGPPSAPTVEATATQTGDHQTGQHSPWEALLAAGLNIMGGTSPHALTNIGRGAMQGLAYGEQQRAVHENEALKQLQQQDTEKYQTGELGLRGQQIAQTGKLTEAQMAQTLQLKEAEMAQERQLRMAQMGQTGSIEAQRLALMRDAQTPQSIRELQAYEKMSPDEQGQFRQMKMAEKGLTDIFGNPTSGAVTPPGSTPGATPTGDDFLKTLNPAAQSQVKALAEGRMAFPSRPNPQQQQLILATSQYDPTFDATDFNKRNNTAKDFASGQSAKAVTAINTATSHLSALSDQMDALHNGNVPAFNSVSNWIKTQTGESAPTTATETRDAVANELRKVFATTGGGGLEELKDWQSHFPINGSPKQQQDAIRQAVDLMTPRLDSLAHQWSSGMGTNHTGLDMLAPKARASWEKLSGEPSPVATAQTPTYNGGTPQQQQAPAAPAMPRGVPPGSLFSPSRNAWRTPDGQIIPGSQ